jgi:SsrA-binding protein
MAKVKTSRPRVSNRRAKFDYELGDSLVVGLQLTGAETKALRHGHGQLRGAHVNVLNNELWLINAQISGSNAAPIGEDNQTRSRKLLAKRKEIDKLIAEKQSGKTIVPIEILTGSSYIKLRIAVGKGKKHYDKRETLKKRQQQRDIERQTR